MIMQKLIVLSVYWLNGEVTDRNFYSLKAAILVAMLYKDNPNVQYVELNSELRGV